LFCLFFLFVLFFAFFSLATPLPKPNPKQVIQNVCMFIPSVVGERWRANHLNILYASLFGWFKHPKLYLHEARKGLFVAKFIRNQNCISLKPVRPLF
jgi:hypothetical protein